MPTANLLLRPVFETPFTFKDAMGDVMNVSLIGVMYGPQGTADISPGIAYRWVGAKFKIVGISDTSSGAPNADISLIPVPSDTETYRPDPSGVMAGCPSFRYRVTAGQTSIGCVIFRGPWDDRLATDRMACWVRRDASQLVRPCALRIGDRGMFSRLL